MVFEETKSNMKNVLEHFQKELKNLRSSRANPGVLDKVVVECYNTEMKIRDLGSVTIPEARQLLVTPFDPQTAGSISKSIEKANLNLQVVLDGPLVRIIFPPLNEEIRKEIVKQAKHITEEAKVSIRDKRRKANNSVDQQKSSGELTEDELKKLKKQIQDLTDEFCKEIEKIFSNKEKEIMVI